MAKEETLIIIKPDGIKKRLIGECLGRFEKKGLKIIEIKTVRFKKSFARKFYSHLKSKTNLRLFEAIIDFICSDQVVAAILEGQRSIQRVKNICGPTNPRKAKRGTIRGDFSKDDLVKNTKQNKPTHNIIHSSATKQEAVREIKMIKEISKS